jgi:LPXTG-motif cell wall-anchored protein
VFNNFIDYAHEHIAGCYDGEEIPTLECELENLVGQTITITYKAKLGAAAVIGAPGQQNTADLTYSNDPGSTSIGNPGTKGTTPETPPVKVYTFDFEVKKVRTADPCVIEHDCDCPAFVPLADAVFNLYKGTSTAGTPISFMQDSTGYRVALSTESGSPNLTSAAVTGLINVRGLDAGIYTLKETTAPDGYNQLTYDIVIRITHTGDGAYTRDFQRSTGYDSTWAIRSDANDLALDASLCEIVNSTGTELPGTGGIGEAGFIGIGLAVIALFAGAIVVYKKKRSLRSVMSNA